jgi:hypothetical protein
MDINNTVKLTLVKKYCTEELRDSMSGKVFGEDFPDFCQIIGYSDCPSFPINIAHLESILKGFKEAGANFVSIYYHEDHNEYELEGINVQRLTQGDIDRINRKKDEAKRKTTNDRIASLEAELERLIITRDKL